MSSSITQLLKVSLGYLRSCLRTNHYPFSSILSLGNSRAFYTLRNYSTIELYFRPHAFPWTRSFQFYFADRRTLPTQSVTHLPLILMLTSFPPLHIVEGPRRLSMLLNLITLNTVWILTFPKCIPQAPFTAHYHTLSPFHACWSLSTIMSFSEKKLRPSEFHWLLTGAKVRACFQKHGLLKEAGLCKKMSLPFPVTINSARGCWLAHIFNNFYLT